MIERLLPANFYQISFETLSLAKNKREAYASLSLLVRIVGLEPTRQWHRNLRVMSPQ